VSAPPVDDVLDGPLPMQFEEQSAPAVEIPTVDIAGIIDNPSPPPAFVWPGRVPRGHVCLLSGHGGSGKSTLALQLAVAVAMGLPLFGVRTTRGRVLVFSGEDAGFLLRGRLANICRQMAVDPHLLDENMRVLDASAEPALYQELSEFGRRSVEPTPVFHRLREIVREYRPSLVVLDNASDTFEGSENDRAQVRGFVRGLATLCRDTVSTPAVLLLTHTPKAAVGNRGAESYSGSTAWHNSARARLSLTPEKDDATRVVLTLDKLNVAAMDAPTLRLARGAGGVLVLDEAQREAEDLPDGVLHELPEHAVLRLLADFNRRDEKVSVEQSARNNAWKALHAESGFPKRTYRAAGQLFAVIRQMERDGVIEKGTYRNEYRKERQHWLLTTKGWDQLGESAPTAPTAPTYDVDAPSAVSTGGAPSAPTSGARGVGGNSAHDVGANTPDLPLAENTSRAQGTNQSARRRKSKEATQ
jgi:archaellum biogenesis ATPase FlaH